jgi:type IV secretion system protein VirB11
MQPDVVVSDTGKARLLDKLSRDLGPKVSGALFAPETIEILLNPDGSVWQECLGQAPQEIGTLSAASALGAIQTIAAMLGVVVTRESPLLEGELPLDGSRFAGQIPPVVDRPVFAIRRKASSVFTLDQYVETGVMTLHHANIIRDAVRDHKNIVVVGGTSSGKTTFLNAVLQEMVRQYPDERFVTIEDTRELQCKARNLLSYKTSTQVTMTQLLRTTLRMRPDRIIVGECRGPEALDLIDAWNTGHEGGGGTIHANSPAAGLTRLRSLVSRNPAAPREIEPLIGEVVHLLVYMAKVPGKGRRVLDVLAVSGYANGAYITQPL